MNNQNSKKSIKTAMLVLLAIGLVGGALAYFSSIALTKHNIFEVITGQKNQDGGLIIEEPSWKEPDKDDHARPGTYYAKDPSLLNNVEYDGYAVIRVRIPKVISKEENQETAQLNEIANICYFGAPQAAIDTNTPLKIGDIVTFNGLKGSNTGDNDKGTFNSEDFSFLGKLTVREGYNDYYFGYNDVLYSNNRTENLFDYIQIKQFTELLGDGENYVDSYVDVDAQMVQSVDTDTGYAYTSVADAWTKVFKKPADSEEFGAVDDDSEPRNIKMPMSRAEHTIIYDGNGANETVQYGQTKANASATVAANKFTKKGEHFTSWNTAADGSGDTYAPGSQYKEDADIVLYAQWEPSDFNVNITKGTGIGSVTGDGFKTYGSTVTLGYTLLEGYDFDKWTSEDVDITNGQFTMPSNDINIQADAKPKTYTVTFDGNGNTGGSTASQTKTHGKDIVLNDNGFTKTDCGFTGWNTKADGSGAAYADGASYTGNSSITLYAQWIKLLEEYTITYNGNGATRGSVSNGTKIEDQAYTIADNGFEKTDHEFSGWNTKADGTGTTYTDGSSYTGNAGLTLYAQWSPNAVMNVYHHHVYSGNNLAGNNTNAGSGSYSDSYYRSGSGGCFTNYYTSSTSSAYYSRNCGMSEGQLTCTITEHVHSGDPSVKGGCYQGAAVQATCPGGDWTYNGVSQGTGLVNPLNPGQGTKPIYAVSYTCGLCGKRWSSGYGDYGHWVNKTKVCKTKLGTQYGLSCGIDAHTHSSSCYHTHTGNSSSGGGCYGSYHSGSTTYYYNRGCGHTDGELLYSIKYNLCGGTVSGSAYNYNATANTVTMATPSKSGYTFTGWKVGDKTYSAGEAIPVTNGMSVIAAYRH